MRAQLTCKMAFPCKRFLSIREIQVEKKKKEIDLLCFLLILFFFFFPLKGLKTHPGRNDWAIMLLAERRWGDGSGGDPRGKERIVLCEEVASIRTWWQPRAWAQSSFWISPESPYTPSPRAAVYPQGLEAIKDNFLGFWLTLSELRGSWREFRADAHLKGGNYEFHSGRWNLRCFPDIVLPFWGL